MLLAQKLDHKSKICFVNYDILGWTAYHTGSFRASHPAAPDLSPGSAKNFSSLLISSWTLEIEI